MDIWILNRKNRFELYQSKRFQEEAIETGVNLMHVDPAFVHPDSVPDAIVSRITGMTNEDHQFIQHFEQMNIPVHNSSDAIKIAEDKWLTAEALTMSGLPTPNTSKELLPYPCILKTTHGSKGEGVFLIENEEDLIKTKKQIGDQAYLFQEFISDSFGKDLRVMVIGGEAVGVVIRYGKVGSFKANVSAGGHAERFELTDQAEKIAIEAAKATGLSIAGVDLLFHGDKLLISEVNSAPSFDGFEQTSGVNIPNLILKLCRKQ